jgi:acyl-ACP thioesterase
MDCKYKKTFSVPMSLCDVSGRLSPVSVAALFMDMAAEDAERRGIGLSAMGTKHFFWLTLRASYRFHQLPGALRTVTAATWPNPFRGGICDRCYTLEDAEGTLLAEGRTEWAVFDVAAGSIARTLDESFLSQPTLEEKRCPGKKLRIDPDFSGAALLGTWRVAPPDIDIGRHMNNVAYLRAVNACRSTEALAAAPLRTLEIIYRSPALEGETLRILERPVPDGAEVGVLHADGSPAALLKLGRGA